MRILSCHGYSLRLLSSLCVASIFVVMILSSHFCELMRTFYANSKSTEFSVPLLELQQKLTTTHDHVTPLRSDSTTTTTAFNPNRTVPRIIIRKKAKLSREQELELGLARARASIRRATAASKRNRSALFLNATGFVPSDRVYRNPAAFYQSYMEMERRFKVHVYTEGEPPIAHDGPCKDIYSMEGRFIHEMEQGAVAKRFKTKDPQRAHVHFMPFSVTWMVRYLYTPLSHDIAPLRRFVSDYVSLVSTKYPFWNRTRGADHFMLACHDWGPHASKGNPFLYNTSIRVLCNANTSEGFNPQKDVSLPEIHLYGGNVSPKLLTPPPDNASRPYLAFFAGGIHGPIRPILLNHWKNRDNVLRVYEYLSKDLDYDSFMLQSKFCLCPSGHEVASPRIVEAIYAECVPVILSQNYVLPFSDVLKWEEFSIQVDVSDIPRLKNVLRAVPEEKYRRLKEGLRVVRRHFVLNQPPKRFDVFHMILHSVWLRRLNVKLD